MDKPTLTQPTDPNEGREAQPVAWMYTRYDGYWIVERERDHKRLPPWTDEGVWTETPLYASPPPEAQPGAVREAEAIAALELIRDRSYIQGHTSPNENFYGDIAKAALARIAELTPAPVEPTEAEAREVAERMWRIHPRELDELGITRVQYYERELLAFASARPAATVERHETLQIGDEVRIIAAEWPEWHNEPPQYIAAVDWHPKHGVTYTTSETWPPRWDGLRAESLTDGWQPQHLAVIRQGEK